MDHQWHAAGPLLGDVVHQLQQPNKMGEGGGGGGGGGGGQKANPAQKCNRTSVLFTRTGPSTTQNADVSTSGPRCRIRTASWYCLTAAGAAVLLHVHGAADLTSVRLLLLSRLLCLLLLSRLSCLLLLSRLLRLCLFAVYGSRYRRSFFSSKVFDSAEVARFRKFLLDHAELLPAAALQEERRCVRARYATVVALIAAANFAKYRIPTSCSYVAAPVFSCMSAFHFHAVHSPFRIRSPPPPVQRAAPGFNFGGTDSCCRPIGTAAVLKTQQVN
jgi:hypothetical protein